MTPQLDEIYVPLAIVERKPPKPPSRNQQEEKEEEKLIPITEKCFFEDVLRQGKSQISQGRKIAIIGEPGSGKTTRLQKIADWILEQDLGLPIWVSLADLTQPTITQYIEEIWLKQTGKSITIDELTQQKERIWLLLDGLDEMTSRVEMRHVSALLGGWVQAARVVVTCRVNVWEADKNAFSGFDVFRNLEFNPEQVTDYIRRWFAGIGDAATGESLETALAHSENYRLKELIQNPLRLWMLCQIWQTGGGLPETQAGLYGQFVDWVYRWNKHKKLLNLYAKECKKTQRECKAELHQALGKLAKAAIDEVSGLFRFSYKLVDEYLGDEDEETSLLSLALSLGWLNRAERFPKTIYMFWHTTFQEYFAALAVDDWYDFLPENHVNFPVAGKEYRIFEPQWKQVILLWLGRLDVEREHKEQFIQALVEFDDGIEQFYWYQAYFLAAAGIAEFKNCVWHNGIVTQLVEWGLNYSAINNRSLLFPFLNPISATSRIALLKTDRQTAIQEIMQQAKNSNYINIRIQLISFLREFKTDFPEVKKSLKDYHFQGHLDFACAIDSSIDFLLGSRETIKVFLDNKNQKKLDSFSFNNLNLQIDNLIEFFKNTTLSEEDITIAVLRLHELFFYQPLIIKNSQFPAIIISLKPYLMNWACRKKLDIYRNCYDILWHCAQNLSYPDFYRAWHGLTEN